MTQAGEMGQTNHFTIETGYRPRDEASQGNRGENETGRGEGSSTPTQRRGTSEEADPGPESA